MIVTDDTIAAIATAPGAAGLSVVRVSGVRARRVCDAVFRGRRSLEEAATHTLHHGWAHAPDGARLDEVVAAVFVAPHSYTGEDVVELSCHGGRVSAERVLAALLAGGARLSGPGEFTLRAFLNGRMDLAQAEAVADVIHAETEAAHELALAQLAGALSRRLATLADGVMDALAEVEARVDFAEDVGGIEVPPHVIARIAEVGTRLGELIAGAAFGRAVREGVRVPLVGRPNVGKSSLFNALVGEERAIVTPEPGTTRDRVSETLEIAGARVTLSDTAGLRTARDPVESIGVARARAALDESRIAVWVVDGSAPLGEEDHAIGAGLRGKRVIVALNKRDLGAAVGAGDVTALLEPETRTACVALSATRGDGVGEVRTALATALGFGDEPGTADGPGAALANPRHVEALERAHEALARAENAGRAGSPGEIVALELREGLDAIGEVTGRAVSEDLLERIFGRFCIGK